MAEACQGVIETDQPFFLYFCPDDPHRGHPFTPDPWNAPNAFGNRDGGYPGVDTVTYEPDEVIVPPFLPDTRECREELAQYYQSVSRIDQGLGRLLDLLEKAGKAENTVILYISDNGIAFPGAKTTVYEPGIRLPCLVKDPRSDHKGVVNHAMISWADLTPTILDFAGIDYSPDDFQGRSFVPKDYLFRPEFELYNLAADPDESANLADEEIHAEVLDRLRGKLKAFQLKTRDPWLIMWDNDAQLQGTGVNL